MSKSKAPGARKGRPRKSGNRYPSGKLKPIDPKNEIVLARRAALCTDVTKASNPLDCALANGWITEADHRAAITFADLHRQAFAGGPSFPTAMDVSTPSSAVDYRGVSFATLEASETAKIWDSAMSRGGEVLDGDADLAAQQRAAVAMGRLKAILGKMPREVAHELDLVAVKDSWPIWIQHRALADKIRARAKAEDRELTEAETLKIANLTHDRFESRRDWLVEGCRIVREVMRAQTAPAISPVRQRRKRTAGAPVEVEREERVDGAGNPVLTVVKVERSPRLRGL